jgi:hypothetical protein
MGVLPSNTNAITWRYTLWHWRAISLFSCPFEVMGVSRRIFMLTLNSGEQSGLEVSRATDQDLQRWMSQMEKERPEDWAIMPSPRGYVNGHLEREWFNFVRESVERKITKLEGYFPAARHDLLISDDTRGGAGDRQKVVAILDSWARDLKRKESRLGKISIVAALDVLL